MKVEWLSRTLMEMREASRGPWVPEVLVEDARRLAEFRKL